jgi:hypothetical protein
MKKFIISEDTEVVLDGKKCLLEAGDTIVINEITVGPDDLDHSDGQSDLTTVFELLGPAMYKAGLHEDLINFDHISKIEDIYHLQYAIERVIAGLEDINS